MVRTLSPNERLALSLIRESSPETRCPHLALDSEDRPYCTKGMGGQTPTEARYRICDTASLQLWCLDPERYQNCIFYKGEKIE